MNGQAKKERIFYYDLLRAFAIFCILACHIFAQYVIKTDIFATKFWYYALFLNCLRDIGVPLFVALSGSLLLDRKETLIKFAKKRLTRVVIPYLFWGIIFILVFSFIFNEGSIMDIASNVFSISPKGTANFFWFVPMILITYALIFIINKLNEYNGIALKICLILSLIGIILINLKYLPMTKPIYYLYYSIFAIIGYYLSNVDLSGNKYFKLSDKKLMIIFLVFSILLYAVQVLTNANMCLELHKFKTISQFHLLNIIVVCCIFLFFRYFQANGGKIYSFVKKEPVLKIIYSISICSYGIYLCHIVIRDLLLNFVLSPLKNSMGITLFSTITLILTFLTSWLLIVILSRIPVLDMLSGSG